MVYRYVGGCYPKMASELAGSLLIAAPCCFPAFSPCSWQLLEGVGRGSHPSCAVALATLSLSVGERLQPQNLEVCGHVPGHPAHLVRARSESQHLHQAPWQFSSLLVLGSSCPCSLSIPGTGEEPTSRDFMLLLNKVQADIK